MKHKYLVEFLGTLFFVYVILATGNPLAIGGALAITLLVTSKYQGGYFNPAVAITMNAANKIPTNDLLVFILAEILGALFAFEIYKRYKI